jgi:WD40 repeat protein
MGTNCDCCKLPHTRYDPQNQNKINNDTGVKVIDEPDIKNYGNTEKPQPIQTYKKYNLKHKFEYSDNITTFLLELNNKKLMTGSSNGTIAIYNLDNFELEYSIKEENKILCLLEFEDNMVLCGTQSKLINLWNINNPPKKTDSFIGHSLSVNCLVKCDDEYFASASNDGNIKIWNYSLKNCHKTLTGHQNNIFCMIKLKNDKLCSGSADKTIRIWDWENAICEQIIPAH